MNEITLKSIEKKENIIKYAFSISDGYEEIFTDKPFIIEYPENIESVPDSIAAVPFVANVIPIIWLTDGTLRVKNLDKDFYDCLDEVKTGYETMFPESTFTGNLIVDNIIPCDSATDGSVVFFSGGLDAVQTLVSHIDEKPHLLTIWGADIRYDNTDGWEIVRRGVEDSARKFDLPVDIIRSSFREFDNEAVLQNRFSKQLKDGWWHGVKHGIGLLGHASPYAYLYGLSTVYIASTNCPADGPVRCASNPLTDNHVRYNGAKVIHDGFEYSRQDKVRNVVNYVKKTGTKISLRVCWETQTGANCCKCEKCYRTMAGLLAEGANPLDYGFEESTETLPFMRFYITGQRSHYATIQDYWPHIQKRVIENKSLLVNTPSWKFLKWIEKSDFNHPETLRLPLNFRIRNRLSQFKFYNTLHKVKCKLIKR